MSPNQTRKAADLDEWLAKHKKKSTGPASGNGTSGTSPSSSKSGSPSREDEFDEFLENRKPGSTTATAAPPAAPTTPPAGTTTPPPAAGTTAPDGTATPPPAATGKLAPEEVEQSPTQEFLNTDFSKPRQALDPITGKPLVDVSGVAVPQPGEAPAAPGQKATPPAAAVQQKPKDIVDPTAFDIKLKKKPQINVGGFPYDVEGELPPASIPYGPNAKEIAVKELQERINNKTYDQADVAVVAQSMNVSQQAALAFLENKSSTGLLYHFNDIKYRKNTEILDAIKRANTDLGLKDDYSQVMATPEDAAGYLAKLDAAYKQKTDTQGRAALHQYGAKGGSFDADNPFVETDIKGLNTANEAANQNAAQKIRAILTNDIIDKVSLDHKLTKDQKVAKIYQLVDPMDYKNVTDAINERDASLNRPRDRFVGLKQVQADITNALSDKEDIDMLNSTKGRLELQLNHSLKDKIDYNNALRGSVIENYNARVASGEIIPVNPDKYTGQVNALIDGFNRRVKNGQEKKGDREAVEKQVEAIKAQYSQALDKEKADRSEYDKQISAAELDNQQLNKQYENDKKVFAKYPTLLNSALADAVNEYNKVKSDHAEGVDKEDDALQFVSLPEFLAARGFDTHDQRVQDFVRGDHFKDYSFFGRPGHEFLDVFKNVGKALGDFTGIRDAANILAEKKHDEMFPHSPAPGELTTFGKLGQNVGSTTAQVLGQGLLQFGTLGIGRMAGLSKVAALRTAFWSSGALTSYDAAYKDATEFVKSEPGRVAYAGLIAWSNAASEGIFPDVKYFQIPGVKDIFVDIAKRVGTPGFTNELARELLDKAKSKVLDYATKFGKQAGKEVFQETSEEVITQAFEDGLRVIAGDPNANWARAIDNAKNTAIQMSTGMLALGAYGGHKHVREEKNVAAKSTVFNAAQFPDEARDAIHLGFKQNLYSEAERNAKLKTVNTAVNVIHTTDAMEKVTGKQLTRPQKELYVANLTAESLLKEQATATEDPLLQKTIEERISNLQNQRAEILDGKVSIDEFGTVGVKVSPVTVLKAEDEETAKVEAGKKTREVIDKAIAGKQRRAAVAETEKSLVTAWSKARKEGDEHPANAVLDLLTEDQIKEGADTGNPVGVLAESYHKAVADGSNPALVEAVKNIIQPNTNTNETTTKGSAESGAPGQGGQTGTGKSTAGTGTSTTSATQTTQQGQQAQGDVLGQTGEAQASPVSSALKDVESTTKAFDDLEKDNKELPKGGYPSDRISHIKHILKSRGNGELKDESNQSLAEAYHKAVSDGLKPENGNKWMNDIEDLIAPKSETQSTVKSEEAERQKELFEMLSDEDKELAGTITDIDKRNKWVKTQAAKIPPSTKVVNGRTEWLPGGNDIIGKHQAEDALKDANSSIATKIMATQKLADISKPYNAGRESDILNAIHRIENGVALSDSEREIKKIYDKLQDEADKKANTENKQRDQQAAAAQPGKEPTDKTGEPAEKNSEEVAATEKAITEAWKSDKANGEHIKKAISLLSDEAQASEVSIARLIAENYHKALADGSNKELVDTVEKIIGKPKAPEAKTEPTGPKPSERPTRRNKPVITPTVEEKKEETKTLKSIIDKFDNEENYTHTDLVNDAEEIAAETGNKKIADAVADYREEQEDDRELGGRGDMDTANVKVEKIIREESAYISKTPPGGSSTGKPSRNNIEEDLKRRNQKGEVWNNRGTVFKEGSFVAKDGNTYTVTHTINGRGLIAVKVKDAKGKAVATSYFTANGDGSYSIARGSKVSSDIEGIGLGKAMYDYVDINIGKIKKTEITTDSGEQFWSKNAEFKDKKPAAPAAKSSILGRKLLDKIGKAFTERFGINHEIVTPERAKQILEGLDSKDIFFQILDDVDVFDSKDPATAKAFITKVFNTVADKAEAQRAYRKLALKYHPDKQGSEEIMKYLNNANDRYKSGTGQQSQPTGQYEDFSSGFSDHFKQQWEKERQEREKARAQKDEQRRKRMAEYDAIRAETQRIQTEAYHTRKEKNTAAYNERKTRETEAFERKKAATAAAYKKFEAANRADYSSQGRNSEIFQREEKIASDNFARDLQKAKEYFEQKIREHEVDYNRIYNAATNREDRARTAAFSFQYNEGGIPAGFYDPATKTAYLVEGVADETTAIHEIFSHPFIEAIAKDNKALYDNLLKEARGDKQVTDYVNKRYGKDAPASEYIARAIDLEAKGELKNKSLIDHIKEFWENAKTYLSQIFGGEAADIKNINGNTTIKQISDFVLKSNEKLNLSLANEKKDDEEQEEEDKEEDTGDYTGQPIPKVIDKTVVQEVPEHPVYFWVKDVQSEGEKPFVVRFLGYLKERKGYKEDDFDSELWYGQTWDGKIYEFEYFSIDKEPTYKHIEKEFDKAAADAWLKGQNAGEDVSGKNEGKVFTQPLAPVNFITKLKAAAQLSLAQAEAKINEWRAAALAMGKTDANKKKVIISLFDYTGNWAKGYHDAGYTTLHFDIQHAEGGKLSGKGVQDLNLDGDDAPQAPGNVSMGELMGKLNAGERQVFIGMDLWQGYPQNLLDLKKALEAAGYKVEGVLGAPPCTSFAVSGARWWQDQHDETPGNDKTEDVMKRYGPMVLRRFNSPLEFNKFLVDVTEEWFRLFNPSFFAMENPVGRIKSEMGLPKPNMVFNPNNFGDPYTKQTNLWGNFNNNLPTANTDPTGGSKVHKLGSSDKIERSSTPEGFAYAFFMANNSGAAEQQDAEAAGTVKKPKTKLSNLVTGGRGAVIGDQPAPPAKPAEKPPAKRFTQKLSDDAAKELGDLFDDLSNMVNKQGLTPNPEDEIKKHILSLKVVATAVKYGVYKFADVIAFGFDKIGQAFDALVPYVKKAYLAFQADASDDIIDKMDNLAEVRKFDYEQFKAEGNADDTTLSDTDGEVKDGMAGDQQPGSIKGNEPGGDTKKAPGTSGGMGQQGGSGTNETGQKPGRGNRGGQHNDNSADGTADQDTEDGGSGIANYQSQTGRIKPLPTDPNAQNHIIEPGDVIVPEGGPAKVTANMDAIILLRTLEAENRNATPQEKKILAKFVGWGGLANYLKGVDPYTFEQKIFDNIFLGTEQRISSHQSMAATAKMDFTGKSFDEIVKEVQRKYAQLLAQYRNVAHYAEHESALPLDVARNYTIPYLINKAEHQAAVNSTINAHYTDRSIITPIWDLIRKLGFTGGNTLESSAGIGHFFGLMPKDLQDNSNLTGVELDKLTGRILKKLYPDANIQVKGFEATNFPNNSFDLAVSNVPFAKDGLLTDPRNPDIDKFNMHNYFIAKNLKQLKPGGIAVMITSKSTFDNAASAKARRWFLSPEGGNAELVGAVRLPNNAFDKNAATQVTTDILVFQKRKDSTVRNTNPFATTNMIRSEVIDGEIAEINVNEYYMANPDNMIGEMKYAFEVGSGGLYGKTDPTLHARSGTDVGAEVKKLFDKFPTDILDTEADTEADTSVSTNDKVGKMFAEKGKVYVSNGDQGFEPKLKPEQQKIALEYLGVRDAIRNLVTKEIAGATDAEIDKDRAELNRLYDAFVKKHGTINKNDFLYDHDIEYSIASAAEEVKETTIFSTTGGKNKKSVEVKKGAIFTTRVNFPRLEPTTAENLSDAIQISLAYRNHINPEYIAEITGMTTAKAIEKMVDDKLVFQNPATGLFETPEEYLSGNVRKKLTAAKDMAASDPNYMRNVIALQKVQPEDKPISQIPFKMGVAWIPASMYMEFIKEKLGVSINVTYLDKAGIWAMDKTKMTGDRDSNNTTTYGVRYDANGIDIIEDIMANRATVLTDPVEGGGRIKNEVATEAAKDMQEKIIDEFMHWIAGHETHGATIEREYNNRFNNEVEKVYKTPPFEFFPGTSLSSFKLRVHQFKAIQRGLSGNPLLLAHGVGTGKTAIMQTIAMEWRRLKTAKKPMIVVQNATLKDFAAKFQKLYPGAKLLVSSEADKGAEERRRFYARIQQGDWDAVIIPQSQFDMIPDNPDRVAAYLQERIEEMKQVMGNTQDGFVKQRIKSEIEALEQDIDKAYMSEAEIADLKSQSGEMYVDEHTGKLVKIDKGDKKKKGGKSKVKADAEKILRLNARIEKQARRRTDNVMYFEDMGIDGLMVDEAHEYKKLGFQTGLQNIRGIDTKISQKALSLNFKTSAVKDKTGGKNIVYATGTPITNTMAEGWTLMRFLQPEVLAELGIQYFDQFANTFTEVVPSLEQNAGGRFEIIQRMMEFVNAKQLQGIFKKMADVVFAEDVPEYLSDPENAPPKLKGGNFTMELIPVSKPMESVMRRLTNHYDWWKDLKGNAKKELSWMPLVLYGLAKKAAIDLRLIDPRAEDDPESKINYTVRNVLRIYKEFDKYKGTQMIFSDAVQSGDSVNVRQILGVPAGLRPFNLYQDIKKKLILGGVPAREIIVMSDLKDDTQKLAMQDKMNSGEVRIVIGGTAKMGVGVNAHERMAALHHIDAPDRPDQFTQRNGRLVRPGNMFTKLGIPVEVICYGIKDTRDATSYGRLQKKDKFVTDFLQGKGGDRVEDVTENETKAAGEFFSEMGARLANSKYAMELIFAERDLRIESNRAKSFYQKRKESEYKLSNKIQGREEVIRSIKKADEALVEKQAAFPDNKITSLHIGGKEVTEKLTEALDTFIDGVVREYEAELKRITSEAAAAGLKTHRDPKAVRRKLKINGLEATYSYEKPEDFDFAMKSQVNIPSLELDTRTQPSAASVLSTVRNHVKDLDEQPERYRDLLKKEEANIVTLKKNLTDTYDDEKLEALEKRVETLKAAVLAESKAKEIKEKGEVQAEKDRLQREKDISEGKIPPEGKKPPAGIPVVGKPHPEVSTDPEVIKDELGLSQVEGFLYDQFKNVDELDNEQFEDILDKLLGAQDKNITRIEQAINDAEDSIDRVQGEIDDFDEDTDQAEDLKGELEGYEADNKKLKEALKAANSLYEQLKDLQELDYYDITYEKVAKIVKKVNARLQSRINVKEGTDLFPGDANIPEARFTSSRDAEAFQGDDNTPATVAKVKEAYPDAIVVQRLDQLLELLPPEVQKQAKRLKNTNVAGLSLGGKVYMVVDNIPTMGRAEGVYRHEKIGHENVSNVLGRRLKKFASDLVDNASGLQLKAINALSQRLYGRDAAALKHGEKVILGKEYIAEAAERPAAYPNAMAKIRAWIKGVLRSLGIDLSVTDKDIEVLLARASKPHRTARKGMKVANFTSAGISPDLKDYANDFVKWMVSTDPSVTAAAVIAEMKASREIKDDQGKTIAKEWADSEEKGLFDYVNGLFDTDDGADAGQQTEGEKISALVNTIGINNQTATLIGVTHRQAEGLEVNMDEKLHNDRMIIALNEQDAINVLEKLKDDYGPKYLSRALNWLLNVSHASIASSRVHAFGVAIENEVNAIRKGYRPNTFNIPGTELRQIYAQAQRRNVLEARESSKVLNVTKTVYGHYDLGEWRSDNNYTGPLLTPSQAAEKNAIMAVLLDDNGLDQAAEEHETRGDTTTGTTSGVRGTAGSGKTTTKTGKTTTTPKKTRKPRTTNPNSTAGKLDTILKDLKEQLKNIKC